MPSEYVRGRIGIVEGWDGCYYVPDPVAVVQEVLGFHAHSAVRRIFVVDIVRREVQLRRKQIPGAEVLQVEIIPVQALQRNILDY